MIASGEKKLIFVSFLLGATLAIAVCTTATSAESSAPPAPFVVAQAGSAGGTIGKKDKSVTGGSTTQRTAPAQHHPEKKHVAKSAEGPRKGCGNIVGTWSWSKGLYGANDTTFNADGTATHRSGITGTWACRPGGEIYIDWTDWYKNRMKLSADGHTLLNLEGGSTFHR